jgi:hypothetical protein
MQPSLDAIGQETICLQEQIKEYMDASICMGAACTPGACCFSVCNGHRREERPMILSWEHGRDKFMVSLGAWREYLLLVLPGHNIHIVK